MDVIGQIHAPAPLSPRTVIGIFRTGGYVGPKGGMHAYLFLFQESS